MDPSLTEGILRRDRWVVAIGLSVLTLLAWAYLLAGAGTGMSVWDATSAALFPHRLAEMGMGMAMAPPRWAPATWAIIVLMWWVMMIAMMTPSAAPMILLYARATRHAQTHQHLSPQAVSVTAFAGGYLLAWLGFSVLATILLWALGGTMVFAAMTMSSARAWFSAAILITAGLYQLSPLKHVCLRQCRNP